MKETRELEKNQLEALKDDDFAVSDEDISASEDENDAKMNLGVLFSFISYLVWYYGGRSSQKYIRSLW